MSTKTKVVVLVGAVALVAVLYFAVGKPKTVASPGALSSTYPKRSTVGALPSDPTIVPSRGDALGLASGVTDAIIGNLAQHHDSTNIVEFAQLGGDYRSLQLMPAEVTALAAAGYNVTGITALDPLSGINYAQRFDGVIGNNDGLALYELPGSNS